MSEQRQSFSKFCAARGFTLTAPQRALSRVVFDFEQPDDLEGADRDVVREVLGDVDEIPEGAREVVAIEKGARAGFTRMSAARCYQLALVVDVDLAPGENAYVLFVGPDLRLARQALSYARGMARIDEASHAIKIVRESADAFTIVRAHDDLTVTLECLPATVGGSAVRARSLLAAVMTEASFFRSEDDFAINDGDIYKALVPRIVLGGQLLLESTVWMGAGLLHDLVQANHGAPKTCTAVLAPTLTMRPDPRMRALVERELARDEANALNEFFCQPKSVNEEAFFADCIDQCVEPKLPLIIDAPSGAVKSAGADLGLTENSSALVIGATFKGIFCPVETLELKPAKGAPLKLSYVCGEFAKVLRRHGLSSFSCDHHLVEPAREWCDPLKIFVKPIKGGAEEKVTQHIALRQAMREGRVKLPPNVRLIQQLKSITGRAIAGGGMRISAPVRGGAHADVASALVIAHAMGSSSNARMISALQSWGARGGVQAAAERLGLSDWKPKI